MTVRLHDEGVVEPDLIFIRADRSAIVDPEGAGHGAVDLVVEVWRPDAEEPEVLRDAVEWRVAKALDDRINRTLVDSPPP